MHLENRTICYENYKKIITLSSYKLAYYLTISITLVCFCICCIVGVVGNGLVIWIAGFKMKTVSAVWFTNLAIVDFMFSITLPFRVAEWLFIWDSRPLLFVALYMNSVISVIFLTVISIDRCVTIMWPLWAKIHRTRRLATISSFFIWVVPLAIIVSWGVLIVESDIHDFFAWAPQYDELYGIARCYVSPPAFIVSVSFYYETFRKMLMFIRSFFMFVVALTIILVCYGLIIFKLYSNTMRRPKRFQKTFRLIIAVMVCFFVCWFPYNVWPLIARNENIYHVLIDVIMSCVCLCLVSISSCINPILYVLLSRKGNLNSKKSIQAKIENSLKD